MASKAVGSVLAVAAFCGTWGWAVAAAGLLGLLLGWLPALGAGWLAYRLGLAFLIVAATWAWTATGQGLTAAGIAAGAILFLPDWEVLDRLD